MVNSPKHTLSQSWRRSVIASDPEGIVVEAGRKVAHEDRSISAQIVDRPLASRHLFFLYLLGANPRKTFRQLD